MVVIELNTITHLTPKGCLSKNLQNLWPYMRPVYSTNYTGHKLWVEAQQMSLSIFQQHLNEVKDAFEKLYWKKL